MNCGLRVGVATRRIFTFLLRTQAINEMFNKLVLFLKKSIIINCYKLPLLSSRRKLGSSSQSSILNPQSLYVFFLLIFSASVFAGNPTQILQQKLSKWRTMTANFQQTVLSDEGAALQQSFGDIAIKRPGKFRWQTEKDLKQTIITNGKQVWIYDPDLMQVTIRQLNQSVGQTPILLLTKNNVYLAKRFTIKKIKCESAQDCFELLPKNKNENFSRVILTFDKNDLISQMQLSNALGQETKIKFSNVNVNKNLDDSLFQFIPPKNIDVIHE